MLEQVLAGESKIIEFKESLPEKSNKYMKTVIGFANSYGGKLIFGINDKTHEIIGINEEFIFKTIDAITNAITDSCEPTIIPDITLQTIDGKTIIVVEVFPGKQRPYFIKSHGLEKGVFIRVSGTTRPADNYMIKELMFEGSNRYFDQTTSIGYRVTDEEINKLCISLKKIALRNCKYNHDRDNVT